MDLNRRRLLALGAGAAVAAGVTGSATAAEATGGGVPSDAALARTLGLRSKYAKGQHYVIGGRGEPLVLLPGWPQTWWSFHKILPALAKRYTVIAVDLRGMGGSAKPAGGYDKKTMAADVHTLIRHLGYDSVHIAGHDIGAMVAHSFAVNHRAATRKVVLMDVGHPDPSLYDIPLLVRPGHGFSLWWFAFNQVQSLPEKLITGRSRYIVDYFMDAFPPDPSTIGELSRRVYAHAYAGPEAIRAGNAWYQAFHQDVLDFAGYGKITAPFLGLTSEYSFESNQAAWAGQGTDVRVHKVPGTGHFLAEENPQAVISELTSFLG
ncbi:alpha/beta fold hydrolase [Kribbella sp. CA-293567]|uniref:alpha/beta fold hydrolase n=1 Tax=Kribbella sp. CA-293567 TaxID=3002436 RepID=UPI0022DDB4CC|nr:alpha/beta hydrolase [Kribbella sp. CA-293567]WBQ03468.1 alpha/beta hydrolase [Kribbella sp. CA-293567]